MKKVVILSSSPRKDGNSETLCKQFELGAKEAGHEVEFISLRDYNLKYCVSCYSCYKTQKCFQNDGLNEIGEKLVEADVIVFGTPVYFYSMSGQLKVFIDRLIPYYRNIQSDIYLIATQYDDSKEMMDMTFESIRGCTRDCFSNCEEKGVIYGTELWGKEDIQKRNDLLEEAYQLGKNC